MAASCVAETSGAASSAIVSEEEQMLAIQKEQFRDQVFDLQQAVDCAVRDGVLARDESECFHQHSVGLYSRTLFMPAGSFIVGKIHKFAHQNIISRGEFEFKQRVAIRFMTQRIRLFSLFLSLKQSVLFLLRRIPFGQLCTQLVLIT